MPTAKQFKDIFADQTLADDTKITIGDSEVTLGDIRTMTKSQQAKLATDAAELERGRAELVAAQQTLATNYAKMVDAGLITVDAQGNISFAEPPKGGDHNTDSNHSGPKPVDYDRDSYVGPVVKMVKEIQKLIEASNANVQRLEKTLNGSRTLYEQDRLAREYASREWPEDMTFDKAVQAANSQKVFDQFGRLNLGALHEQVSKPIRLSEKELTERVEARAAEIAQERAASSVQRPGFRKNAGTKPQFKNLDEAMRAAEADPEIQQQLSQIVPGVM